MDEDQCGWYDVVCHGKEAAGNALTGTAGEVMKGFAREVTAAVIDTVASLGVLWTGVDSADLTAGGGQTQMAAPQAGEFETQVSTLLGYAAWLGFGVTILGFIFLGVNLALSSRRGEGQGLVNRASIICISAIVIGSATSVVGFLVPSRSLDVSSPVAFVQDQMLYLTLALAVLSVIVAGAKMAFTMRAEPGLDLVKSLVTLVTVSAAGVVMINALAAGTDALARQIIDSSVGSDGFRDEVLAMLGMVNGQDAPTADSAEVATHWLGGSFVLIIVGGFIAIVINIIQLALMALRTAMLILMAGILPLSAAFLNTETGRNWFGKVVAWVLAFLFYKPAAALIYAVAIKISVSGAWDTAGGQDGGLLQFAGGMILILASVLALPVLIGFLSPVMGAMASSSGGTGMAVAGLAAAGGAAAQGASRSPRSGRGFGGPTPGGDGGGAQQSGADPSKGAGQKAKSGGAALAGGKLGMAMQAGKQAMEAVKGTSDKAKAATSEAAGAEGGAEGSGGESKGSQQPGGREKATNAQQQDQGQSPQPTTSPASTGAPSGQQNTGTAPKAGTGNKPGSGASGASGGPTPGTPGPGPSSSGASGGPSKAGPAPSTSGAGPAGGGSPSAPSRSGASGAATSDSGSGSGSGASGAGGGPSPGMPGPGPGSSGGSGGPSKSGSAPATSGAGPTRSGTGRGPGGFGTGSAPAPHGVRGGRSQPDTGAVSPDGAKPRNTARTLRDLTSNNGNAQKKEGGPDGANRV